MTSPPHDDNPPAGSRATARPARLAPHAIKAMSHKPGSEPSEARLRVFVCSACSTAEVIPWCGQNPDCGHPECADALSRCAAPHRLDGRWFHGQVNVMIIERHLWDVLVCQ